MPVHPSDSTTSRWTIGWSILFLVGLAAWLALLLSGADTARAWRALLVNFLYFTPIALGLVTWSAIVVCSNGTWPRDAERLSWTGLGFLLPSLLLLVALWIGSAAWAPWNHRTDLAQGAWLGNTFLFVRDLVALAILWAVSLWYLSVRKKGRRPAWISGGILIVFYCIIFTLIGFDLIMALNPDWHSTIFGAYFFITSLYGAVILWTFLVVIRPEYGTKLRRDFGNLIIAFGILSTYFTYIQLLTIWYENLPDETPYPIHRMNYLGWDVISALIVALIYLGPLVWLLTIWAKSSRVALGGVSLFLLVGLWFERWWLVAPTFSKEPVIGWVECAGTAMVLGVFGLSIIASKKYLPAVPVETEKERAATKEA